MASFHAKRNWQAYLNAERALLRRQQRSIFRQGQTLPMIARHVRRALMMGLGVLLCFTGWVVAGGIVAGGP